MSVAADHFRRKKTILDADQMWRMVRRMADQIVERNRELENIMLVGIRTRGVPLAEALAKEVKRLEGVDLPIGTLDITLYRDDLSTIASHPVVKATTFPGSIEDKVVILCDDVLYTGRTIRAAMDALIDYGRPKAVRLAVMIDRGLRELPIQADYVGKTVHSESDQIVDVFFPDTDGRAAVEITDRPSEDA